MIGVFEGMVRQNPQRTCFTFVDKEGNVEAFSYREVRMMAAGLASLLRRRGVEPGDAVVIDLPNNPAFVIMLLAAAYGGFSLITMNTRLTLLRNSSICGSCCVACSIGIRPPLSHCSYPRRFPPHIFSSTVLSICHLLFHYTSFRTHVNNHGCCPARAPLRSSGIF